jgi:23S rRNA (uracil1939-C5)-methyltransferase
VFIDGALPGERVRFRVFKRRRQFDEAGLVDVLTASVDRVTPRCVHFGICGGCSLQHLAPSAQLAAKERQLLDNLSRIGRVRPDQVFTPLRGPDWAYRRRARLGVKYVHKKGRVLAGFRERDKPYLADLRHCDVLVERFAELPQRLAALVESLELREKVPQVEMATGDGTAALVFRVMEPPSARDLGLLDAFGEQLGVQIFLQSGGLDTVRPLREGYPPLSYSVDERITLEFGPVDFVQINGPINRDMVAQAVRLLEPTANDTVLDLFCGIGNFTLSMALRAARVVGVEGDATLVAKARANATRNRVGNADFHVDNLFEPSGIGDWGKNAYDLVLLDPPRAGAAEILERMPHWRPRRLVYISCHSGSFARDAGILVGSHGFRLSGAGVMDMFPHTTHVESIAVFERVE